MTIKEIASLAGVSNAMVSRYLNGGYVSQEKREVIKKVIDETGYRPSRQARSLRSGKANLVGVVVPKISSEAIARVTAGIGEVLADRGYQMVLANTDNHAEAEVGYLDVFRQYPVDGIILSGTSFTQGHQRFIQGNQVPFVVVGQHFEGVDSVFHDDRGAAVELAKRLARQHPGATFSYVAAGNGQGGDAVAVGRFEGVREGLLSCGVVLDDDHVRLTEFGLEQGHEAACDLLAGDNPPDVIMCATDTLAAGALQAVRERFGAAMGEGVPVVSGFGDNQMLRAVTAGIPTVHFGYRRSARCAAIPGIDLALGTVPNARFGTSMRGTTYQAALRLPSV